MCCGAHGLGEAFLACSLSLCLTLNLLFILNLLNTQQNINSIIFETTKVLY